MKIILQLALKMKLDLEIIDSNINRIENIINNAEELDIIYPSKILQFAQDLYTVSNYINNLEEENDIKNGLILSKGLHAKLLSEWAEKFYGVIR